MKFWSAHWAPLAHPLRAPCALLGAPWELWAPLDASNGAQNRSKISKKTLKRGKLISEVTRRNKTPSLGSLKFWGARVENSGARAKFFEARDKILKCALGRNVFGSFLSRTTGCWETAMLSQRIRSWSRCFLQKKRENALCVLMACASFRHRGRIFTVRSAASRPWFLQNVAFWYEKSMIFD